MRKGGALSDCLAVCGLVRYRALRRYLVADDGQSGCVPEEIGSAVRIRDAKRAPRYLIPALCGHRGGFVSALLPRCLGDGTSSGMWSLLGVSFSAACGDICGIVESSLSLEFGSLGIAPPQCVATDY